MFIKIEGNRDIAQDVLRQIELWDQALISQDIDYLENHCASDVVLFDISTQLFGIQKYKSEWERTFQHSNTEIQMSRCEIQLYVSVGLAFLSCYSRVECSALERDQKMPWCRTTMCLQKVEQQWSVVHQHISMPVDLKTGQAIVLKDESIVGKVNSSELL